MSAWISQDVMAAIGAGPRAGLRLAEVRRATGLTKRQLDASLRKLAAHGFIARPEDLRRGVGYRLTTVGRAFLAEGRRLASGPRGPQPGKRLYRNTFRERIWRQIRAQCGKPFTLAELLSEAADGSERDATSNAGKYLRALARAGLLLALRGRDHTHCAPESNGYKRYYLARDLGPLAPRWLPHRNCVYDPNSEQEHAL